MAAVTNNAGNSDVRYSISSSDVDLMAVSALTYSQSLSDANILTFNVTPTGVGGETEHIGWQPLRSCIIQPYPTSTFALLSSPTTTQCDTNSIRTHFFQVRPNRLRSSHTMGMRAVCR